VVVGGSPESRGVVSTCSYEARKFGIHSAMPTKQAYKLCPHAIFVHDHHFSDYKEVSEQIREIFYDYTDLVEPLSLDEAFLDVTVNTKNNPSATRIAEEIRTRIKEKPNSPRPRGFRIISLSRKSPRTFTNPTASPWSPPPKRWILWPGYPSANFGELARLPKRKCGA